MGQSQYIDPMPAAFEGRGLDAMARHASAFLRSWRRFGGGRCAICRGWCDGLLCAECDATHAAPRPRCAGCGMPAPPGRLLAALPIDDRCLACRRRPPPWRRVVAGVDYAYPWAALVAQFKFGQRVELARVLCLPLQRRLAEASWPSLASGRNPWPCLVPIPLARERLRERGFNQAWELARRLARDLHADALPDALFRVRDTSHQPGLARAARSANLHDAFVVSPHHAARVRGAAVALVDDVLTTGATARAATRALRAAGARSVDVWVVARAA